MVVRGWAIPPYKVGRRFGPGTPHEADMVKNQNRGSDLRIFFLAWLGNNQPKTPYVMPRAYARGLGPGLSVTRSSQYYKQPIEFKKKKKKILFDIL